MVKQYLYCPMIPYLILNLGVRERVTELMKSGKRKHERKLKSMKKQQKLHAFYNTVFLNILV